MSSRALPWRAAIVVCVLALLAGACADDEPPLRIGVVVDCVGIFRSFGDAELSGAQLPLIERGARRRGGQAQDGITPVTVAGRSVELVTGCTEAAEFSVLTTELRRMAELEKVDAVVAGSTGADEIVIRDVARGHPQTVFLPVVHGPREVTLRRPAANVFRFSGDHGQGVAGLATYAYRDLGWRRAAIVLAQLGRGLGQPGRVRGRVLRPRGHDRAAAGAGLLRPRRPRCRPCAPATLTAWRCSEVRTSMPAGS